MRESATRFCLHLQKSGGSEDIRRETASVTLHILSGRSGLVFRKLAPRGFKTRVNHAYSRDNAPDAPLALGPVHAVAIPVEQPLKRKRRQPGLAADTPQLVGRL